MYLSTENSNTAKDEISDIGSVEDCYSNLRNYIKNSSNIVKLLNPTNYSYTTLGSSLSPSLNPYSSNDVKIDKTIEFEQIDGNMVLLKLNKYNVEDICEKTIKVRKFTKQFPFIKYEYIKFLEFKHKYNTYRVKSTITALTEALGIEYTSYAELSLKDAIKNG